MKDMALLHGMSTSEGSHGRARYYMHTGYREGVGGVVHPSLGAIASRSSAARTIRCPTSSPSAAVPTAPVTPVRSMLPSR